MSLFHPQTIFVSTTLAREGVKHRVLWQVFWLPCPLSDLPVRRSSEQWHEYAKRVPFSKWKRQGHSGGPAPDFNGIPY
jgi:hypothetical protein